MVKTWRWFHYYGFTFGYKIPILSVCILTLVMEPTVFNRQMVILSEFIRL